MLITTQLLKTMNADRTQMNDSQHYEKQMNHCEKKKYQC